MSISIPTVSLHGNTVLPQGPNVIGTVGVPLVNRPRTTPLFRDYGKNVNDALSKNFPSTYKAELTTAKDNGLNFVFAAERRRDKDTNAEFMFVSSQAKFEHPSGLNLVGTIDSEKLEGEITLNKLGVDGLKTVFKGKFLDNDKQEASAEVQYNSTPVSSALGLFHTKDNKTRVEAQVSAAVYEGLTAGVLASYFLPNGKQDAALDNYQAGLLYNTPRLAFSETLKAARDPKSPSSDLALSLNSRVFYVHDKDTRFAADVTHAVRRPFKEVDVKLFGERNLGNDTTGRVAVEKSGKVRLALAQKLNSNFTLTIGAEANALRLEEHNIGVTASFTA